MTGKIPLGKVANKRKNCQVILLVKMALVLQLYAVNTFLA